MQSPYEIEVNEEYFILDLVGVIGSIGGTLGLCIGFSFMDLFRDLGTSLVQALTRIIRHKKEKKTKTQTEGQLQRTGHLQLKTSNLKNIPSQDDLVAPIIAKLALLEKRLTDHDQICHDRFLEIGKKQCGPTP